MKLNLAHRIACTDVEGPGKRAALWVQGCAKRCPGCCNPGMLEIRPAALTFVDEVCQWLMEATEKYSLEGVTFLGGEPMLQAKGLAQVASFAQSMSLSVMVFTGYTGQELDRLNLPGTQELLEHTDVMVSGPYLAHRREARRNWVGSDNQQFHYLSRRYGPSIEDDPRYRPELEVRMELDGSLEVNGFPLTSFLHD